MCQVWIPNRYCWCVNVCSICSSDLCQQFRRSAFCSLVSINCFFCFVCLIFNTVKKVEFWKYMLSEYNELLFQKVNENLISHYMTIKKHYYAWDNFCAVLSPTHTHYNKNFHYMTQWNILVIFNRKSTHNAISASTKNTITVNAFPIRLST